MHLKCPWSKTKVLTLPKLPTSNTNHDLGRGRTTPTLRCSISNSFSGMHTVKLVCACVADELPFPHLDLSVLNERVLECLSRPSFWKDSLLSRNWTHNTKNTGWVRELCASYTTNLEIHTSTSTPFLRCFCKMYTPCTCACSMLKTCGNNVTDKRLVLEQNCTPQGLSRLTSFG